MSQQETGTRDETYNLVAVLYHALQGAENAAVYQRDAEGQQDLADFFGQVQDSYRQLGDQAKQLLGQRLSGGEA